MSEDTYVGTISKHEMVVDRYDYESMEQKALAWDAMYDEHTAGVEAEDIEEDCELREKMDGYLRS